jgi:uncharacterized protein YjbI with pentapeptide repeats
VKTIVNFWQSLFHIPPIPTELIRAKAYEIWKAQGGGESDPDANWEAAIAQVEWEQKVSRRNFILELLRIIITSLSTTATIFGGIILFLNFSQGENRLITERYTRSIEQLGNPSETIRIGGIYALERIANDSPRDRWTIMEVLSSFIRSKQGIKGKDTSQASAISTDAQAALTAIKRRQIVQEPEEKIIDLSLTNLRQADLFKANLNRVKLTNTILAEADLRQAQMMDANLMNVNLTGANLLGAKLDRSHLVQANLSNSNLSQGRLSEVNLNKANLSGAFLDGIWLDRASLAKTNCTGSVLINANLREANFKGANLSKANFNGADLTRVDLTGANLNKTDFRQVKNLLPSQILKSNNWKLAIYDEDFYRQLVAIENVSHPISPGVGT